VHPKCAKTVCATVIRLSSFAQCPPSPYSTVRRHKSLRLRFGTDSTSESGMSGTGRRRPYDGFGRTRNWPSPCNHVAKLSCTEAATRDARTGRNGIPLLRNDLHGKFWLPVRNNVEKPTCIVLYLNCQQEAEELVGARPCPWWSACQASDEAGPGRRIHLHVSRH